MEGLDLVELFTRAGELYGLSGDGSYGEGGSASRVAVELREHNARYAQRLVKGGGSVYGVLARHRVNYEKYLVGIDLGLDALKLLHQIFVDVEPSGSVEENEIVTVLFRVGYGFLRYLYGVLGAHLENRDAELTADSLKLLYSRRTVDIAGDEKGTL